MYEGTIVEESLEDARFLNDLEQVRVRLSSDPDPARRWHLWSVRVTREQASALRDRLAAGTWYAHFWDDREIVAVFRGKEFVFAHDDADGRAAAAAYGRSLGIPEEQLDFVIG